MFGKKKAAARKTYDPENEKPALRCSICTGEQVAGFRNLENGKFTEIMLVRSEKDLKDFKDTYGVTEIERFY
ncbi:MAG: aspartate dehydrogenase [Lachnospiraceae bacterium]|nr:aspartate dehydrogenase [Lachnospiraceae bacterium]